MIDKCISSEESGLRGVYVARRGTRRCIALVELMRRRIRGSYLGTRLRGLVGAVKGEVNSDVLCVPTASSKVPAAGNRMSNVLLSGAKGLSTFEGPKRGRMALDRSSLRLVGGNLVRRNIGRVIKIGEGRVAIAERIGRLAGRLPLVLNKVRLFGRRLSGTRRIRISPRGRTRIGTVGIRSGSSRRIFLVESCILSLRSPLHPLSNGGRLLPTSSRMGRVLGRRRGLRRRCSRCIATVSLRTRGRVRRGVRRTSYECRRGLTSLIGSCLFRGLGSGRRPSGVRGSGVCRDPRRTFFRPVGNE